MNGLISSARQSGESLVDLDVGIADAEVGEVVVTGQPAGHGVGDFVGLEREALALDKPAEGFGVSEVFLHGRVRSDAGAEFALVVAAGEVIDLTGSLVEDLFALILIREDRLIATLGNESIETCVLSCRIDFLLECCAFDTRLTEQILIV